MRAASSSRCRGRGGGAASGGEVVGGETRRSEGSRGAWRKPDFVLNAGGLINVYNELGEYNQERALRMTRVIYINLMRVFEISERDGVPTHVAANRVAAERIGRIRSLGTRNRGRMVDGRMAQR